MNTLELHTDVYNYPHTSFSGLLEKTIELSSTDFDAYFDTLLKIHLRRKVKTIPDNESGLLQKINKIIPNSLIKKSRLLSKKMNSATISNSEYQELVKLTETIEALNVTRLTLITELATIKNMDIDKVMEIYELKPESNE